MLQEPTKDIFKNLGPTEVGQVWAEALEYYRSGEQLNLSPAVVRIAQSIREGHSEIDERQGLIETYLATPLPDDWIEKNIYERREYLASGEKPLIAKERTRVCVAEIWCEALGGMQKDMTTHNTKYIHEILKNLKIWKAEKTLKRFRIYGHQRAYEKAIKTTENRVNTNFSLC
jgi:hypothetical protein